MNPRLYLAGQALAGLCAHRGSDGLDHDPGFRDTVIAGAAKGRTRIAETAALLADSTLAALGDDPAAGERRRIVAEVERRIMADVNGLGVDALRALLWWLNGKAEETKP